MSTKQTPTKMFNVSVKRVHGSATDSKVTGWKLTAFIYVCKCMQ